MWLGAVVSTQDGVDMMESFTVGSASSVDRTNFGALAGLVYPTDSIRLCGSADSVFTTGGVTTSLTNVAVTLNQQFSDFGTATMPATSSWIDIPYEGFGIEKAVLHLDDWCSRYNQAAKEIAGGQQIDTVCAWWNG